MLRPVLSVVLVAALVAAYATVVVDRAIGTRGSTTVHSSTVQHVLCPGTRTGSQAARQMSGRNRIAHVAAAPGLLSATGAGLSAPMGVPHWLMLRRQAGTQEAQYSDRSTRGPPRPVES